MALSRSLLHVCTPPSSSRTPALPPHGLGPPQAPAPSSPGFSSDPSGLRAAQPHLCSFPRGHWPPVLSPGLTTDQRSACRVQLRGHGGTHRALPGWSCRPAGQTPTRRGLVPAGSPEGPGICPHPQIIPPSVHWLCWKLSPLMGSHLFPLPQQHTCTAFP